MGLNVCDSTMQGSDLVVWILACYGITFLLCSAELTATPRRWLTRIGFFKRLLGCYFCTGFWVGLTTAYCVLQAPSWAVLHGFAGATSCYGLDALIRRLEATETEVPYGFDEPAPLD